MSVTLKLYTFNSEVIRINKAGFITQYGADITGVFREAVDVLNPSILIEYSGYPACNYAYIQDLSRYYYIRGITSEGENLWRLNMHVDVLMSYAGVRDGLSSTGIFGMAGYVERYAQSDSDYLIENAYPLKGSATISSVTGVNTQWAGSQYFLDSTDSNKRYVLLFNGAAKYNGNTLTPSLLIGHVVCDYAGILQIMADLNSGFDLAKPLVSYICSLKCLPQAVNVGTAAVDSLDFPGLGRTISVASTNAGIAQERVKTCTWSLTVNAPSTINKWKNFQPYSGLTLTFLPFGRFALDNALVFASGANATVTVKVKYDIVTGDAVLSYSVGGSADIYLGSSNVAIDCPFAANSYSIAKVASSALSFGTGLASLAAGNVVGGISGTAAGMINAASAFDACSSSQSAGGYSFIDNAPRIDTVFHDIEGTSVNLIGKPYCADAVIGTLSGYVQMGRVHVENLLLPALEAEKEEIESLLLAGVIV